MISINNYRVPKNILFTLIALWTCFFINGQNRQNEGEWSPPIPFGIVPVAVANLPDGKLLTWSSKFRDDFGGSDGFTYTELFDPLVGQYGSALGAKTSNTYHDMFCPGINNLPNGNLLVAGGSSNPKTSIYDYKTELWHPIENMNIGRGYQGNVTLSSGEALTFGGSWSGSIGANGEKVAEIWNNNTGWRLLNGIPSNILWNSIDGGLESEGVYRLDNHAWLWTAPNGKVFHAGPGETMHWLDISDNGSFQIVGKRGDDNYSMKGTTVMFDIGKILKVGGANSYSSGNPAKDNSYVINFNYENNVEVQPTDNALSFSRTMHNSVVLPNGEVLVTGGLDRAAVFTDTGARLTAEIFNPDTNNWRTVAGMQVPRTYHSVAILQIDGRVFVGGGGLCADCNNHMDAEIYSPPYLFDSLGEIAQRPIIHAPYSAFYGQPISITSNENIESFAFIRMSSATHSTNNEQRRIPMQFTEKASNQYEIVIPNANEHLMPPGYYMLFAMNNEGVPSIAEAIKIGFENNQDLIISYGFNELSGAEILDNSGNLNDAIISQVKDNGEPLTTLTSSYRTTRGVKGSAIEMDGLEHNSNSILRIPSSNSLRSLQDKITVMSWVYRDSNSIIPELDKVANASIFAHDYPSIFFGFHNTQYKWSLRNIGGIFDCYTGYIPFETWVHIAATYDGSVARLFVNGVEICSGITNGLLNISNDGTKYSDFSISGFYDRRTMPVVPYGNSSTLTDEFSGKIDDFKLYKRALDQSEINEIYDSERNASDFLVADCNLSPIETYYKIDDGPWIKSDFISAPLGSVVYIRGDTNEPYFITTPIINGRTFSSKNDLELIDGYFAYQLDTNDISREFSGWNDGLVENDNQGYYVLTLNNGCLSTIQLRLSVDCQTSGPISEYRVNGQWSSGNEILEVYTGDDIILSGLPNSGVYTITDNNGMLHPDNFILGGIDSSKTGIYVIINEYGCATNLEIRLRNPEINCESEYQVFPEYRINGDWFSGENEIYVEEGKELMLSGFPNSINGEAVIYSIYNSLGNSFNDGLVFNDLNPGQSDTFIITNQYGCSASLNLFVTPTGQNCSSQSPTILSNGPYLDNQSPLEFNAMPEGGVWSGDITSDGIFDPSNGPGIYLIKYTYTYPNGCVKIDTVNIEVYPTGQNGCFSTTTISLNKPTQQSSTYANGNSSLAVDGNIIGTSPWLGDLQHTTNENQPWWQVDLEQLHEIQQIVIFNRTDGFQPRLANFYVMVSSEPFTESASLQELVDNSSISKYFFNGPAGYSENFEIQNQGRYVRIQLTGSTTMHMAEVEVIGCVSTSESCIGVNPVTVNPAGPFTDDQPVQTLSAVPSGGTWGGDSTDGTFDPSALGVGTYNVTYTTDNGAGCVQTADIDITVTDICGTFQEVTIDPAGPFTDDQPVQTLSALPSGGTWGGDSTDGTFDPSALGVGTYNVTYTVDYGNGCTKGDAISISVGPAPTGNGGCASTSNLALGATASQSSTYGNGAASLAVDGNTTGTSPWSADLQHTNGQAQPWWQVDLGGPNQVEEVVIHNRSDKLQARLNNFYVMVSQDPFPSGATLQNLLDDPDITKEFFAGSAGLQETVAITAYGQYVRIQLSGTSATLHMAEVMVMGCANTIPDPCENVAQASIDPAGPFTDDQPVQTLSALPSGGTWGGDSTDGTFDPSALGVGTYNVTYTTDNGAGCVQTADIDITVTDICGTFQEVTIDPAGPFTDDQPVQTLSALPSGGTWGGDSTDGTFDPSALGVGTYNVTYTVDYGNGCTKGDAISISVGPAPTGNGGCASTSNLALGATASQSSTYGNGAASLAVDGNTTGTSPWSADLQHTNGQAQPWWQVDLGGPNQVEEVVIHNRSDKLQARLNNFYVMVSQDPFPSGATLQNLLDDPDITKEFFAGSAGLQETVAITAYGQYVRIQLSGTSATLHMAEVMVMGCANTIPDPCENVAQASIDPAGPFTDDQPVQTLSALPSGGTWGGDSTDGTFDPSALGVGTYNVTYTTDNGAGCVQTADIDITVTDICGTFQEVTIDPAGPFTDDQPVQTLSALPSGGTWGGDSTDGTFDPSALGVGTYNVTYTVDYGNGCTKGDAISIPVGPAPTGNGGCASTSNLALGATASQSSTYGNGAASFAVDGNTTGTSPWSADLQHTNGQAQPWWQVDLGGPNQVEEVVIHNRSDKLQARLNNFYVMVSQDPFPSGATLQNLLDDPDITKEFFAGSAGLQETVAITAYGQYVRIQLSGTSATLHMAEVMVMGCANTIPDPCENVAQASIDPAGPFTDDQPVQTLSALPSGGTWGGDSTDGTFDPSALGVGTYNVTYTTDNGAGCVQTADIDITVTDICGTFQEVTIDPAGPFTDDQPVQTLSALPSGGTWGGDSTDGTFDPSALGVGTYNVTYTVDYGNGCTKGDAISISVGPAPTGNGGCASTSNLALGATASQSSTYGNGAASLAVDGNTTGTSPWSADLQHTNGQAQPWWQVDLGGPNQVEEVVIHNRSDKLQTRLNNFYVMVSQDPFPSGATLQNLLDDPDITKEFFAGSAGLQETVAITAYGQYVRIQLSGTSATLHMAEVMVMGCGNIIPFTTYLNSFPKQLEPVTLQIYPVPSNEVFYYTLPKEFKVNGHLVISDSSGKIIYKEEIYTVNRRNRYFKLENLAEGLYSVLLSSENLRWKQKILLKN